MRRLSKSGPETRLAPAQLLAREVADLHREKARLLEENVRLQTRHCIWFWPSGQLERTLVCGSSRRTQICRLPKRRLVASLVSCVKSARRSASMALRGTLRTELFPPPTTHSSA
jgi:hypothetical protein